MPYLVELLSLNWCFNYMQCCQFLIPNQLDDTVSEIEYIWLWFMSNIISTINYMNVKEKGRSIFSFHKYQPWLISKLCLFRVILGNFAANKVVCDHVIHQCLLCKTGVIDISRICLKKTYWKLFELGLLIHGHNHSIYIPNIEIIIL